MFYHIIYIAIHVQVWLQAVSGGSRSKLVRHLRDVCLPPGLPADARDAGEGARHEGLLPTRSDAGAKGPQKHKDPPCLGPWKQHVESCGLWGPYHQAYRIRV